MPSNNKSWTVVLSYHLKLLHKIDTVPGKDKTLDILWFDTLYDGCMHMALFLTRYFTLIEDNVLMVALSMPL